MPVTGSGKSTFAQRLFDAGWGHRICQDELGSRQICESTMVQRLLNGHNVVIDRCNFDAEQRKHWIGTTSLHLSFSVYLSFFSFLASANFMLRSFVGVQTTHRRAGAAWA